MIHAHNFVASLQHALRKPSDDLRCGFFLLLVSCLYLWRASGYLPAPNAPDAELVYLPYAKRLLSENLSFLMEPESVYVPLLTFIWPALFGGEAGAVKLVNMYCGVIMLLLMYGIGKDAHSRAAGMFAALAFAVSPFLIIWIPTALSEPPFFLFTLLWLWSIGKVIAGSKWAIAIGCVGLTLSILTRPVWLYPSLLLCVFTAALPFFMPALKAQLRPLLLTQTLGLVIPVGVIVKNVILFDLPGLDTGTGGALFYGANIITKGFEPPILGMNYEDGGGSRTLLGNREHAAVAMRFFQEITWREIADWYAQKISWVLLFTTLEMPNKLGSIYRAVEISLAASGFWWGLRHKQIMVVILGGGVAIQVLQTSFVLYNIRYSIDNVELILAPLAAIGFVVLTKGIVEANKAWKLALSSGQSRWRAMQKIDGSTYWFVTLTMLLALLVAIWVRQPPVLHLPPQIPYLTMFQYDLASMPAVDASTIKIPVPAQVIPDGYKNAVWKIDLAVSRGNSEKCSRVAMQFSNAVAGDVKKERKVIFNLRDEDGAHSYLIGTAMQNSNLFPETSGWLTLESQCRLGTDVKLLGIRLIVPQFIEKYFPGPLEAE